MNDDFVGISRFIILSEITLYLKNIKILHLILYNLNIFLELSLTSSIVFSFYYYYLNCFCFSHLSPHVPLSVNILLQNPITYYLYLSV